MAPVQSSTSSVDNVDTISPDQALKVSPTVEPGPSELYPSAPSKSDHNDVVKGENKYWHHLFRNIMPTLK